MRALVVYESMYGNTHTIAESVADGLRHGADVTIASVSEAAALDVDTFDLLVVGGPTHVHTVSRRSTRRAAVEAAQKDERLHVEPHADGDGLREWLTTALPFDARAAAFDTRMQAPAFFTGRASKRIAKLLRAHGCRLVTRPQSFLVTKENTLVTGEAHRARLWGAELATRVAPAPRAGSSR